MGLCQAISENLSDDNKEINTIININILWFDENINNDENQLYFNRMKTLFKNVKGYNDILDEGFEIFYKNNFEIIYVLLVEDYLENILKK